MIPAVDTCFVIMPFAEEFRGVYRSIQRAATSAGLIPKRADSFFEGKAVLQKILTGIEEARVVVADLTGRNPNVFYELGIAHVRKDTTVLLTQRIDDVPFDLRHLELVEYQPTRTGLAVFQRKLTAILVEIAAWEVAASSTDVKVLYWSMSHKLPYGAGLVVENIGEELALDLEGQRLMPGGGFESCTSLKSLQPHERAAIFPDWTSMDPPPDAPAEPPTSYYLTRVIWNDKAGTRHVGPWGLTDKRG